MPSGTGRCARGWPDVDTADFVVDETLTLIRFRLGLPAANAWWQQIDGSGRLRWARIGSDHCERGLSLFFHYRDKDLSFTDCTSIAVMRELRLTTVLTTDHHFQQVGFNVLPAGRSGGNANRVAHDSLRKSQFEALHGLGDCTQNCTHPPWKMWSRRTSSR